jgi:hypothetical protein
MRPLLLLMAGALGGCSTVTPQQRAESRYLETLAAAAAVLTVDSADGISEIEAYKIAADYFHLRGTACGMVGAPGDEGGTWRVLLHEGIVGERRTVIVIRKSDGHVSVEPIFPSQQPNQAPEPTAPSGRGSS